MMPSPRNPSFAIRASCIGVEGPLYVNRTSILGGRRKRYMQQFQRRATSL
jgi:hypothetical protein